MVGYIISGLIFACVILIIACDAKSTGIRENARAIVKIIAGIAVICLLGGIVSHL